MECKANKTHCDEVHILLPGGGHIAGRWYGNQTERPILALHGWLDNCGTFARIAPWIASHRSVLCIDLPGHGESSHLPPGILYHKMEFVRVILHIMQAYQWKKVSFMGHSMGSSVAFHFASIYPDRVDMLIGLDAIKGVYWPPKVWPTVIQHTIEKAIIDNDRLMQENPMEPPTYTFADCEKLLYEGSQRSVDIENCKFILQRNVSKSQLYPDKYFFSRDGRVKYLLELNPDMELALAMAKRICKQSLPYLIIKGGASTNGSSKPTELDDYLMMNNKNFECHIYPLGTHHLHLNHPEPVAQIIIGFLQKHGENQQLNQQEHDNNQLKTLHAKL